MILYKYINSSKLFKILYSMLIIMLFISVIIGVISNENREYPKAQNGVLNLDGWNLKDDGTVMLNGEWAFYWKKFVSYTESAKPDIFADVPDVWNSYKVNREELSGFGYARHIQPVRQGRRRRTAGA
ncbi:MAG: hypothetical protein KBI01_00015 [Oscillospiraceae bacterium]|nr:hypothetical protein [Oscillospiraceae bacterium]